MSAAQLMFAFPLTATFEEVSAAVAKHFGGAPINLSTGEEEEETLRDASAVFTGVSASTHTVSTGATPETAVRTLDLDTEGLPWDERIHSGTKAKNEDGKWKLRKGMGNSAQLPLIKAELKQRVQAMGLTPQAGNGVSTGAVNATAAQATNAGLPAETANLHNQSDDAQKARLAYAHEQAIINAGPMTMLTQEQFDKLKRGQTGVEVLPAGLEWFRVYQQAFNNAYAAYAATTLAATEASLAGTVHMHTQAINPNAPAAIVQVAGPATAAQPVTVSPAGPGATAIVIDPSAAAPAPIVDFPSFAMKYAATPADVLNEVFTPLGIVGGLAGLAAQPAMIPAVVAMLQARGL